MIDLPLWLWLIALTTALIASTITTITSIGAGLIAYGILGFFFDLKLLIPLLALSQALAGTFRTGLFRHYIRWREAVYLFLGVIPGTYCGAWLFHILSESALRRLIGIFLLGFALYEFWRNKDIIATPHIALIPIGGLGAGLLLGSIGVAGPLLAIVFLRYGLVKEELVAMIALFFFVGNLQRLLIYWQQNQFPVDNLELSVTIGIVMIGGVYIGRAILPHISRELFVSLVLGMLLIFGIKFLFW